MDHLGDKRVDLFVVPGGCQVLAGVPAHRFFFWLFLKIVGFGTAQLVDFLVKRHKPTAIIIFEHEDCGWRKWLGRDGKKIQMKDMIKVGKKFSSRYGVAVEMIYASLERGEIKFYRCSASADASFLSFSAFAKSLKFR